jgi:hypothetical protein
MPSSPAAPLIGQFCFWFKDTKLEITMTNRKVGLKNIFKRSTQKINPKCPATPAAPLIGQHSIFRKFGKFLFFIFFLANVFDERFCHLFFRRHQKVASRCVL